MTAARAIALACTIACAGCSSGAKSPDRTAGLAELQILETATADGSIRAADVFALDATQQKYRIIEGEGAGTELVLVCSPSSEHQATFARAEGERRTQFLRAEADGRIVMTAVLEVDDQALSLFNPPLLIMPTELLPGQEVASESAMRVVDSKNLKHARESGRATRTIQYLDDQRIRTPLGEFAAKRIVIGFKADLRMADAEESTTLWIVEGQGVIAQQNEEHVKVLGLGGKKKRRTLVLIEAQ